MDVDHELDGFDAKQPSEIARRMDGQRKLIFSHKGGKIIFVLAVLDLIVTFTFAALPDTRAEDAMIGSTIYRSRFGGIMLAQAITAWISVVVSAAVVMLIWITFSVPSDRLTFERKNNLWYVVIANCLQVMFDVALLGYPTVIRQLVIFLAALLRLLQIFYHLHLIRISREPFSRRIRPPLVIKALLDMKGDSIATAEPLTMGMLERLEGIVKVRDQLKFNVKHGRENLLFAVQMLLIFSLLSFFWEFTKVLTYQSRHFDRMQLDNIDVNSNLPMYWPSRAFDATADRPLPEWEYRPGSTVECEGCDFPRSAANSKPKPVPNSNTRVVQIVIGGLPAGSQYTQFLSFRQRPEWKDDAIELTMRVALPSNAVPNWLALVTGLTPDIIGALGNRNVGSVAFDNIFRMMRRFEERWWCAKEVDPKPYASTPEETTLEELFTITNRTGRRLSDGELRRRLSELQASCADGPPPGQYNAAMSASPWFTGLVKEDLQHLHGDGSASLVANEDDSIDWSEIFQSDTSDEDALRASVAHLALGDAVRPYHYFLLHFTDTESQATNHGADDSWNRANLPANGSAAPWSEFVPRDVDTAAWRGNSFKRAIARIGDQINSLMDSFANDDTVFIIAGDHGHVPPGGSGGASPDVRLVPLFAYKRNSGMGTRHVQAQRDAGSPVYDSARFVARARLLTEWIEPPTIAPNDKCDIMGESLGGHVNTCDEWRPNGDHQVEIVDLAPTVMALLGLPVPRDCTGVFIDDIVGLITANDAEGSLLGTNCTETDAMAEADKQLSQDRMCKASYGPNEDPSSYESLRPWGEREMIQWRHVLHYRDLYQQKLSYVREFLSSVDRLEHWAGQGLAFLKHTADAAQYYDEGSDGRCAAYDPFNALDPEGTTSTNAHKYTILPLEFGRCGGCNKKFVTGDKLTVLDYVVCNENDWNKVKVYYVQGVKGLLVVYNREIALQKSEKAGRNIAITAVVLLIVFAMMIFIIANATLADPMQLVTKRRGEEFLRPYYQRPDVRAFIWAISGTALYFITSILVYYLSQNLLGFVVWDASVIWSPVRVNTYLAIAVLPSYGIARLVRGLYMWHYRYIVDKLDEEAPSTPLLLSPVRIYNTLSTFFAVNARSVDVGTVYLIRIYLCLVNTFVFIVIAVIHCIYSFIIPFIYRIVFIDEDNWTLRFQVITVQLISFPLWVDSWWCLHSVRHMLVDGVSVSQLYEMRSEKEERRAGGFPPEDEMLSLAGALPTAVPGESTAAIARRGPAGSASLSATAAADPKEAERRLAEAELDGTLSKNRIAQLEDELDRLKVNKADALTDAKLNNEFVGKGFADLQLLLESGFHQLERFYAEAGGGGGGGGGLGPGGAGPGGGSATAPLLGGGKVSGAAIGATSEQLTANGGQVEMRSAVQKTLDGLREENTVALDRQHRLLDALNALDPDGEEGDEEEALLGGGSGGGSGGGGGGGGGGSGGGGGGGGGGGSCALVRQETTLALTGGGGEEGGGFIAEQGERIASKLEEAKATKDELARMVRQRDERQRQVVQLEREAVVTQDEREKLNDDLAGVQAERDLLERKVNELRRELHAKNKEIEHMEAELKLSKSQQVRAMAKLSVQKSKAEKQLVSIKDQLLKLSDDKSSLFREVGSLESQLAQAHADREEARNWASTYRDMLLKVA